MASFSDLLRVLDKKVPDEPTLFEFYLNVPLLEEFSGKKRATDYDHTWNWELIIPAYKRLGYGYATMLGSQFHFPTNTVHQKSTISLNEGFVITDRKSFQAYRWPEAKKEDYSCLAKAEKILDKDKKLVVWSNGGVLENVISLVGYENLCFMLYEDRELAADIFREVGERLFEYYVECLRYDAVGAVICNDDWGFNSQTMLSPNDLREFVFPYHKKIVAYAHKCGRPAILHSCGNLDEVYDDIIDDMKFDGKHSYQDVIEPVEEAYDKYHDRIAIIGGIDMDFVARKTPQEIEARAIAMLEKGRQGGYALGTGNSIPEYIPKENYLAMIGALFRAKRKKRAAQGPQSVGFLHFLYNLRQKIIYFPAMLTLS